MYTSKQSKLPSPVEPVLGRTMMTDNGAQFENHEWLPILAPNDAGLDPFTVPLAALAAAGHPRRSATGCLRRYFKSLDQDMDKQRDKGLKRLREICIDCSGDNRAEVRRCTHINCPLWAHRLGRNPFNRRS